MMHCTMDDVLALAAGEGSAWARQHVAGCAACRAELEALYQRVARLKALPARRPARDRWPAVRRSEEHTSELQSRLHLVCRLLLEKKKTARRRRKAMSLSSVPNLFTPISLPERWSSQPSSTDELCAASWIFEGYNPLSKALPKEQTNYVSIPPPLFLWMKPLFGSVAENLSQLPNQQLRVGEE